MYLVSNFWSIFGVQPIQESGYKWVILAGLGTLAEVLLLIYCILAYPNPSLHNKITNLTHSFALFLYCTCQIVRFKKSKMVNAIAKLVSSKSKKLTKMTIAANSMLCFEVLACTARFLVTWARTFPYVYYTVMYDLFMSFVEFNFLANDLILLSLFIQIEDKLDDLLKRTHVMQNFDQHNYFSQVRISYLKVRDEFAMLQQVFGPLFMFSFIYSTLTLILMLYFVCVMIAHYDRKMIYIVFLMYTICQCTAKLAILSWRCQTINKKGKQLGINFYEKIVLDKRNGKVNEVYVSLLTVFQSPFEFRVCGVFTFTPQFFIGLISAIISYMVYMLSFGEQEW